MSEAYNPTLNGDSEEARAVIQLLMLLKGIDEKEATLDYWSMFKQPKDPQ